jgi:hypothetical protein
MRAYVVACAILASTSARAGEHPTVQLEIDPCVAAPADEIRRIVAVELGALLEVGGDATVDRTRVRVGCEQSAITLRVDDPITGKSLARTIDLADAIPAARGRLVALAIAELVSASWTELEVNPEPRVRPSGPRPSAEARDAALAAVLARTDHATPLRSRLALEASGERFFGGTGVLAGAGLRFARDSFDPLGWMVDAQAHHGSQATPLGRVSTDVIGLGAIVAVHRAWSTLDVHLGGGVRGGAVELSGVADPMTVARASRFWASWFGVLAVGSVGVTIARRFVVEATLEGGEVVVPVGGLVGGRRIVAVDGAWLDLNLSVGMFL